MCKSPPNHNPKNLGIEIYLDNFVTCHFWKPFPRASSFFWTFPFCNFKNELTLPSYLPGPSSHISILDPSKFWHFFAHIFFPRRKSKKMILRYIISNLLVKFCSIFNRLGYFNFLPKILATVIRKVQALTPDSSSWWGHFRRNSPNFGVIGSTRK